MTAAAINPVADPSSIERLHAEIMRILPDPQLRKLLDLIENDAGGDSKLYKLDTLYQRILSRWDNEREEAFRKMIEEVNL